MTPIAPAHFQAALATWFAARGRVLRFRATAEPWAVLVSEVMLQQTQVVRVEPVWEAFMQRFPTPAVLDAAGPAAAVRAWAGLGYNRRAINLWRAAAEIVARHDGNVPRTVGELEALPGVGPYTARAVAAIAFGSSVAAVDVNVRRVVGRAAWGRAAMGATPAALQAEADRLVDPVCPAAWTHAVMDVGATICKPTNPRCSECPLRTMCGFAAGVPGTAGVAATRMATDATGRVTAPSVPHPAPTAFPGTTRWLRGRIVDRLRGVPAGDWVRVDGPVGTHDSDAVGAALAGLARDGLLELGPDGSARLPLAGARKR